MLDLWDLCRRQGREFSIEGSADGADIDGI